MEVFHVGDKVFLDNRVIKGDKYGKIIDIDTQNNLMAISLIDNDIPFYIKIDSPHIHKIDFLPKDRVVIHDLLKDYCNKRGIVDAYGCQIDRYRVMVDNDPNPHWFAPFELSLEDNFKDDNNENEYYVASFSSSIPIKVKLSDKGKKAYEEHFGVKPLVDAKGRTEFANLAHLYDLIFISNDKLLLEDDDIFVKVMFVKVMNI